MAFHTQVGDVVSGVVQLVAEYGVFVHIGKTSSLLHISQISRERVVDVSEVFSIGDKLKVGRSDGCCHRYSACVAPFAHRADNTLPPLNILFQPLGLSAEQDCRCQRVTLLRIPGVGPLNNGLRQSIMAFGGWIAGLLQSESLDWSWHIAKDAGHNVALNNHRRGMLGCLNFGMAKVA